MKYSDPKMEAYFASLPSHVKAYINRSKAEIATYGELMQIGEHFRHSLGPVKARQAPRPDESAVRSRPDDPAPLG